MRVKAEILQRLPGAGNETSQRSEGLGERPINERDALFHSKLLSRPTTVLATCQHGMRFVDEHACAVRLCDGKQFRQVAEIAVHRINALNNHKLAAPFLTTPRRIKRGCAIMFTFS